jgi:hypothetical protein
MFILAVVTLLVAAEAVRIATIQSLAGHRDLLRVSNLQTGLLATEASVIGLRGLERVNRVGLLLALRLGQGGKGSA